MKSIKAKFLYNANGHFALGLCLGLKAGLTRNISHSSDYTSKESFFALPKIVALKIVWMCH